MAEKSESRVESILRNILGYEDKLPKAESRVEELLIELKNAIEAGGGGGGDVTELAARLAAAERSLKDVETVNEAQNKAIGELDKEKADSYDVDEKIADVLTSVGDVENDIETIKKALSNYVLRTEYAKTNTLGLVAIPEDSGLSNKNGKISVDMDSVSNGLGIEEIKTQIDELRSLHQARYGFKIDKNDSNPLTCVHYMYDAVGMTPAHMDYEKDEFDYGSWKDAWFIKNAYPVALKFDGTEDYRLDPDDYSKKFGSDESSNIDDVEYDGNFMMAFPTVWFKRYEDARYNYIEICSFKYDSEYQAYAHVNVRGEICDKIYLPLFKGIIDSSGKLRSISGVTPGGNTSATAELSAATSCGKGWQFWDHSSREMICDLLTLIGRSIDSQTTFGNGQKSGYDTNDTTTYGKNSTGTLTSKGMFYGTNKTTDSVKVLGIEEFWANRYDRLLGILLINGVWTIKMTSENDTADDESLGYNFTGSNYDTLNEKVYPCPQANGYLKYVSTSKYGSIPKDATATSTTFFKDYFYVNLSGIRVAICGGACDGDSRCGFRYAHAAAGASYSYWYIGASPLYKPL